MTDRFFSLRLAGSQKSLRDLYDAQAHMYLFQSSLPLETVKELSQHCAFFLTLPIQDGSILPLFANRVLNLIATVVFNPSLLIATAVLCEM